VLVEEVIQKLKEWGAVSFNEAPGKQEKVVFSLPRDLAKSSVTSPGSPL
jgi:4-hydroxy-3-methylbut-2-enyl diphosphate reductase